MCYNCGCQMPDNDMGKGELAKGGGSLVENDFKAMAQKWGMNVEETKKNVLDLLQKEMQQAK